MMVCRWRCGLACVLAGAGRAVAEVDILGSGGQGEQWRRVAAGGGLATQLDQLERVARQLQQLGLGPVCLLGRGYGGWLVLASLLANTPGLAAVRCGLVTAPVTDWDLGRPQRTF